MAALPTCNGILGLQFVLFVAICDGGVYTCVGVWRGGNRSVGITNGVSGCNVRVQTGGSGVKWGE